MKRDASNPKGALLLRRLAELGEMQRDLLHTLATLPAADLTTPPAPGKWAPIVIVEHMVLADLTVFAGLPALLLPARRRTLADRFRYLLVLTVLRLRIPLRVPSEGMIPTGRRSLEELRELWATHLANLVAYTARQEPASLLRAVFFHSVAGPLTVAQAVGMARIHMRTHLRQIHALIRAAGV